MASICGPGFSFQSATVTLSSSFSGSFEAINRDTTESSFIEPLGPGNSYIDSSSSLTIFITGTPSLSTAATDDLGLPGGFTLAADDGVDGSGPDEFTSAVSGSDFDSGVFTSAAAWVGTGNIFSNASRTGFVAAKGTGGDPFFGGSAPGNLTIEVDYVATEDVIIPVPAALPLMASALGVFGVMRYRKRK
jgi:hypothetical protein